jgi:hypothetical protein
MKNQSVRIFLAKVFLLSAVVCILSSFSLAPAVNKVTHTINLASMQVKYLGGDNTALNFYVKYDNKSGKTFRLLVLDEAGEVLYQDNYSTKDFEKKIKTPRLTETDYVIFLIKPAKEIAEISYKVKVTTKVVDDHSIVKN